MKPENAYQLPFQKILVRFKNKNSRKQQAILAISQTTRVVETFASKKERKRKEKSIECRSVRLRNDFDAAPVLWATHWLVVSREALWGEAKIKINK